MVHTILMFILSRSRYVGTAAGVAAKQLVDQTAATVQDVDVKQVQDTLVNKFHQLIHIPGPPPPPGPAPSYYNVSGAGAAKWNGHYVLSDQESLHYSSASCDDCSLYANGQPGVWRLAIAGKELFYVASQASGLPPLKGWTVANGASPAPTLIAGPL